MAKVDETTQLDISNKISLGVLSTSNDKNYFEEIFGWDVQLVTNDIYAQTVPYAANPTSADANVTANPTIIQKVTTYRVDQIPGSNGQGYSSYQVPGLTTSARLTDWLNPQKFGPGYAATLTQWDDTPINLTDGAFQIDYKNGLVRFDPNYRPIDLGYATPLKATFYRYIGERATSAGSITVTETDLNPSVSEVTEIRFQPGTVTDLGGGVVEIANSGAVVAGDTIVVENFTIFSPTISFNLAQAPADSTKVFLLGNGVAYSTLEGHITVVGNVVTWQAIDFTTFDAQDEIIIKYTV